MSRRPKLNVRVDGVPLTVPAGVSILDAANRAGRPIPTLCHLPGRECRPVCRICSVEVRGRAGLVPACATAVTEGMDVVTDSAEIAASRRVLMSLVLAEHGACGAPGCEVEILAERLGGQFISLTTPATPMPSHGSDYLAVDPTGCIHCDRCIRACEHAVIGRLGRGGEVGMIFGGGTLAQSDCIQCGDCAAVCPSGAIARLTQKL